MKRLTIKFKTQPYNSFYDLSTMATKLWYLENIEEELGVELFTLFDGDFYKIAKKYIKKKPFIYVPFKRKKEEEWY